MPASLFFHRSKSIYSAMPECPSRLVLGVLADAGDALGCRSRAESFMPILINLISLTIFASFLAVG
jgi:hypothetical protein